MVMLSGDATGVAAGAVMIVIVALPVDVKLSEPLADVFVVESPR